MIRNYEILFLLSQREDIYKNNLKTIQNLFEEIGFNVLQEEDLGIKELAYPVQKHLSGRYHVYYVTVESTLIRKLEKELALSEEILRYLILEVDENAKKFLFNKDYKHYHHRKAAEYSRKREETNTDEEESKTGTDESKTGVKAPESATEAGTTEPKTGAADAEAPKTEAALNEASHTES